MMILQAILKFYSKEEGHHLVAMQRYEKDDEMDLRDLVADLEDQEPFHNCTIEIDMTLV
jgi:hypothetical protein